MKYTNTSIGFLLFVGLMGALRMGIELIWYYDDVNYMSFLGAYSMFFYAFVIATSIPSIMLFLNEAIYKNKIEDEQQAMFYAYSARLWFVYPLVPAITVITNSSYSTTIPLFEYIPTFMVERNFFPTGMTFVIPIIIVFFTYTFSKFFSVPLLKSALLTVLASTTLYLVFYQWGLNFYYTLLETTNFFMAYGIYHLIMSIFLVLVNLRFSKVWHTNRNVWFARANLAVFFILLIIGFIYQ